MSKYGAKKVIVGGVKFASKAESYRYCELAGMLKRGEISDLELQPVFELAEKVKLYGEKRTRPAVRYVADFRYRDRHGCVVIEDVKGVDTPVSRLKRHLMATVHGFDVRVVR